MAAEVHSRIIAIINTIPRVTTETGYGAVTATLLTPSSTVSADSTGFVAILPTGNAIRLYVGGIRQLTDVVYGPVTTTQNNLTCAVNSSTGVITITQATNWTTTTQEVFNLTATYNSIVYTVLYTITKAVSGTSGTDGLVLYNAEVFAQNASEPARPSGGSYTFTGDVFVTPAGFTKDMPTSSLIPIWRSVNLFSTRTPDIPVPGPGGSIEVITDACDRYFSCGPTNDPYWANVVLMVHGDGTDGATTAPDTSLSVRVSTNNGAVLSTTQKKFGSASIWCQFDSHYFSYPFALTFAAGEPLTVEFWLYRTSSSGIQQILGSNYSTPEFVVFASGGGGNFSVSARMMGVNTSSSSSTIPLKHLGPPCICPNWNASANLREWRS